MAKRTLPLTTERILELFDNDSEISELSDDEDIDRTYLPPRLINDECSEDSSEEEVSLPSSPASTSSQNRVQLQPSLRSETAPHSTASPASKSNSPPPSEGVGQEKKLIHHKKLPVKRMAWRQKAFEEKVHPPEKNPAETLVSSMLLLTGLLIDLKLPC